MPARLLIGGVALISVLFASVAPAVASELTVLCSNGLRAVMLELAPVFEQATQDTVKIDFAPASVLAQRIVEGQAFDLAILTPEAADALIASGHAVPRSRTALARSPLGLAMKAGAPKPSLESLEGLRATLLAARSITYATQGASAKPFEAIVERLGLTADIASRIQPRDTGAQVGQAVASGAVEYGVIPLSEILPVEGVAVAGLFPPGAQSDITMIVVISPKAPNPQRAAALIRFLVDPVYDPILKARGMQRP